MIAFGNRQPPYAQESEVCVLGGILIDPNAFPVVLEILADADFYREAHRRIYRGMHRLFQTGQTIDPPLLMDMLRKSNEIDGVGGPAYIAELLDTVPTAANIRGHAGQVREAADLRRLIEACGETMREAYDPAEMTTEAVVRRAQDRVMSIGAESQRGGMEWLRSLLYPQFEEIENRMKHGGIVGMRTGFRRLDAMTGGFRKKDLIILGGRPSMGKTALALSWIRHIAISERIPVALFALEGGKEAITDRLLASEGGVDLSRILNGRLTDDDYVNLAQAASHLITAPIAIDDRGGLTMADLLARARRFKVENPELGLIVVDHIHLMAGEGAENRTRDMAGISAGLKTMAKELAVPVVALAQLSREPEKRKNPRPTMADLRESGSIEQDADVIMFAFRPEYYVEQQHGREKVRELGIEGKAEIIVAKQRNGPTDLIPAFFEKHTTRWYEVEVER
jgi:replicative DNA helicase